MGKNAQERRRAIEERERQRKAEIERRRRESEPWVGFWKRAPFWVYTISFLLMLFYPLLYPYAARLKGENYDPNYAIIHTSKGDIEFEFYRSSAPKTVKNFVGLSRKNFYDNLTFHRVVPGFVVQGGDPKGDGTGGESLWGGIFEDEINPKSLGMSAEEIYNLETKEGYKYDYKLSSHKIDVGAVAMANSGPNTNNSQFFIVTEKEQPHLNGKHTVFGHVTRGLDIAKAISEVPADENGKPNDPVVIRDVELK